MRNDKTQSNEQNAREEGVLRSFETVYVKKTKHRKRCRACNKLIQDGERVIMKQIVTEKYYPVKGIMRFAKWLFTHVQCKGR